MEKPFSLLGWINGAAHSHPKRYANGSEAFDAAVELVANQPGASISIYRNGQLVEVVYGTKGRAK